MNGQRAFAYIERSTIWLRIGTTLKMNATCSDGSASAIAIAACNAVYVWRKGCSAP